jgi:hypothetical protein
MIAAACSRCAIGTAGRWLGVPNRARQLWILWQSNDEAGPPAKAMGTDAEYPFGRRWCMP